MLLHCNMWQIGPYLTIDIAILRPHYKKSITDSHFIRPLLLHTPGFHFPANNCPPIGKILKKAIPRGKQGRLWNQEKDKEQKRAYYWRNLDKIAVNKRICYRKESEANAGSINERERV
jgi:hypothetical protein